MPNIGTGTWTQASTKACTRFAQHSAGNNGARVGSGNGVVVVIEDALASTAIPRLDPPQEIQGTCKSEAVKPGEFACVDVGRGS